MTLSPRNLYRRCVFFSALLLSAPLTLGLLIDTSASQMRVLPMEQEAGEQFLRQVLGKEDLAFLINFDIDVTLDQDYTSDVRELRRALDQTRINAGGAVGGGPGAG